MRQQAPVDDGPVRAGCQRLDTSPAAAVALDLGVQRLLRGQDLRRGHVQHLAPVGRRDAELFQEHPRRLGGDVRGGHPHHRAALDDRLGEHRRDRRHGVEARGLGPAAGLAEDRHVVRIAAELCDVALDPLQGQHDVGQALVARAGVFGPAQLAQIQIAQHAQAMIGGDHHHVVLAGQHRTVLSAAAARAGRVAAAVIVEHHRLVLAAARRGPEVQHQAVLARRGLVDAIDRAGVLQRGRAQLGGVEHPGPRRDRLGRLEAVGARDAGPVRHALVGVDAPGPRAAQPALGDLDLDGLGGGVGGAGDHRDRQGHDDRRATDQQAAAIDPGVADEGDHEQLLFQSPGSSWASLDFTWTPTFVGDTEAGSPIGTSFRGPPRPRRRLAAEAAGPWPSWPLPGWWERPSPRS